MNFILFGATEELPQFRTPETTFERALGEVMEKMLPDFKMELMAQHPELFKEGGGK